MSPLPFNLEFVQFLADHRTAPLTEFFLAVTALGTFYVYVLIVTLIYVAWNKQLAIRLSVLLLSTSSLNGLLKFSIRNPRPFVHEGTYLKKWAVSSREAAALAGEYSTPSGHAMSAAAFYSYLGWCTRNAYFRVLAVVAILLIGLSRPYLGVHYVEDVLLGWAIGIACALVAIKYLPVAGALWNRISYSRQIGIAVSASLALWLLSVVLNGGCADGAPTAFLSDAGFLTGIVIARPLELRIVNFDPRSSHIAARILRFFLTCALVLSTVIVLNPAFWHLSASLAWFGFLLQYVRFAAVGVVNIFLAPLLFTKMGLAKTAPAEAN
ncbi:MAG: phosphatase PAP2 family protein [Terracidiphilus sp.]|nr:phosphatase PAP2 family protein [Terracidiphilus sp.]